MSHCGMKLVFHAPMCWLGVSVNSVSGVVRICCSRMFAWSTRRPVAKGQYDPTPSLLSPSVSTIEGLACPRGATRRHSHASEGGRTWNRPRMP
jgi:hypothetical protein